ncbi:placenta-specific 8 [Plakobranchus ocellatus]|uniref:Placenta-specific 8 n=1 Tax=Plakobranchus ocellatus TaxID=259542 RepID=A0AAV4A8N8_9GAST|nr:placenta-specific 8 [Plakobranchus ocellatus]
MTDYNYGVQPPQYDQKGPSYGHPPPVVQSQPMGGTTVIVQQAPQVVQRPWNSGLFDCFDDFAICLCGTFCGLCLACQVASDMNESVCVPCCVPAPLTVLRTKWRTQNHIEGSIMNDCLLEACCGPCAHCQLAREVKQAKSAQAFNLN